MTDSNPLVGAWKLVSCEFRRDNGQTSFPYGQHPEGFLLYAENGYMSATLMTDGRALFTANDLRGGPDDEIVAAARGYLSYAGTYDVQAGSVVHHVAVSLFPNWIGGDQERLYELADRRLTLSTRPMVVGGTLGTAHLVWDRA